MDTDNNVLKAQGKEGRSLGGRGQRGRKWRAYVIMPTIKIRCN